MKGNLILISADVDETMSKILPQQQGLFPVSLKRKMEYEGHYIREVIDKDKLKIWHEHMKMNNPLFRDVQFDGNLVDEFCEEVKELSERMEIETPVISTPEDEIEKETLENIPISKQYDTLMCNKYEQEIDDNTVPNIFADMVIDFETQHNIQSDDYNEDLPDISDPEDSSDEERDSEDDSDVDEDVTPRKKPKLKVENIAVAPGEGGTFQNYGENLFIEELAFPHLFPRG